MDKTQQYMATQLLILLHNKKGLGTRVYEYMAFNHPTSEEGQRLLSHIQDLYGVLSLCEVTLRQYIPPEDQQDSITLREITRVMRWEP